MSALLSLEAVTAWYGHSQALFGMDLELGEGEVLALMGRNGMGKTTTIRTIMSMLLARSGAIRFAGEDITRSRPHLVSRRGIGLVPEGRRCFPNLTVSENLIAAARPGPWDMAAVCRLFPRLEERRGQMANTLSGGEQQMLAIARALMTNPRLLIMDEATEGLAPVIRQEIWAATRDLKKSGLSILLVDKSIRELATVSDRCTIIEKGVAVWQGEMSELTRDLQDRYLGV